MMPLLYFSPYSAVKAPYVSYSNANQTVLFLKALGVNGSNNKAFIDSSSNSLVLAATGTPTQGSFSPYLENYSNYFNGSTDYLTAPYTTTDFNWWDSDYTIESWINPTAYTGYTSGGYSHPLLIGNRNPATTIDYFSFGTVLSGQLTFYYYTAAAHQLSTTATVPLNKWTHVAMTFTGGVIRLFIDGTLSASSSVVGVPTSSTAVPLTIGSGNVAKYAGHISNLRIVKGTAVYTSNFTPPTAALTAITGTTLLTCQSNHFKDNSVNNFEFTVTGTPKVESFNPFSPTAAYSPSVNGGSMYFNGSTDYVTSASSSSLQLGTSNFTIEFWINFKSIAANQRVCGGDNPVSAGSFCWSMYTTSAGALNYYLSTSGSSWDLASIASIGAVRTNTWYHVALVRNGSTFTAYLNGEAGQSVVSSASLFASTFGVTLGTFVGQASWLNGYISNFRLVKGTAIYTSNFVPPTVPLTAVANTQLLLSGTNAGIIDETGNNDITTAGNAVVNTTIKKFNGSIYFDNTDAAFLSLPDKPIYDLQAADFTIEFWMYQLNNNGIQAIYSKRLNSAAIGGLYLPIDNTSVLRLHASSNNSSWDMFNNIAVSPPLSMNTWHHVAVTRSGSTWKVFVDGVQTYTATNAAKISTTTNNVYIGANSNSNAYGFHGYLENFRITKGLARYTANFTPPTE